LIFANYSKKMALYTMLFGKNPNSDTLWKVLDLDEYEVGRFRDVSLRDGQIILLTRNGGGNREDYESAFESLSGHPNYIKDYDCDWDCTYAEIVFSVPEKYKEETAKMDDDETPDKKFEEAIANIDQHVEKFVPLMQALNVAEQGDVFHPDGTKK
jgi:hypothetical protein